MSVNSEEKDIPATYIIYEKDGTDGAKVKTFLRYFKDWSEIVDDTMLHEKAIIIHCNNANLAEIPEEIGLFRNLKELNCSNNNLYVLPESLAELENLEKLYIFNNKILTLPDEIGRLKKLQRIDAGYNMLDTLPESFAELEGLRLANFVHNNFKYMPHPLVCLRGLQSLYFADNHIKTLPSTIGNMVGLRVLNMSGNCLWKALPEEFGNLINLDTLSLDDNCISQLPSTLGNMVRLKDLYLQENQLAGLPTSIGRCAALTHINISNNEVRSIPVEIVQCANLQYIQRSHNELDLHPVIQRFLDARRNIHNHTGLYADSQNVHTSSIQESIKKSLFNLLNDPYSATKEKVVQEIIDCPYVKKKELLIGYVNDDKETHSVLYCTFFDAFVKVWGRIIGCVDEGVRRELFKRLDEEMSDGECKCFTGRLSRIVNVLNGFFDDIEVHISSNEQIANVILVLRERHGLRTDDDMGEDLKETIRKELAERGYEADIIETWLNV